jgi:DNA-binding Lrp family transcriptional regulator
MGSGTLALDNILSAVFFFVGKWTPALSRNHSRDLLRFLLCRLYDQSRGQLMHGQITLAQGTLARKLGLSRTWTQVLVSRLQEGGWIEYAAPVLENGMRGSCSFRVGRQLKRLLIMLVKCRKKKKPAKSAANSHWQFSPSTEEKKQTLIREAENAPPKPELLARIPVLRLWLQRGEGQS